MSKEETITEMRKKLAEKSEEIISKPARGEFQPRQHEKRS